MPSINGVELRNFLQQETDRGIAYEGDLYIDGDKAGYFENKGNGGSTNIMILNENGLRDKFNKRVLLYYKNNPARTENQETFTEELMALWDDLQVYEGHSKGKILLAVSSYSRQTPIEEVLMHELIPTYYTFVGEQQLEDFLEQQQPKFYKVYKSLEDFNI